MVAETRGLKQAPWKNAAEIIAKVGGDERLDFTVLAKCRVALVPLIVNTEKLYPRIESRSWEIISTATQVVLGRSTIQKDEVARMINIAIGATVDIRNAAATIRSQIRRFFEAIAALVESKMPAYA